MALSNITTYETKGHMTFYFPEQHSLAIIDQNL
jgi:hypothetical protein